MGSAASHFATAMKWSCSRNPASRSARYFPELVEALRQVKARQFVLDGEIVISIDGELRSTICCSAFIPPRAAFGSCRKRRRRRLIVFDLLVDEHGRAVGRRPLEERRPKLEGFAAKFFEGHSSSLFRRRRAMLRAARGWLKRAAAPLDGVVAKRLDLPYQTGDRTGMVKIKNLRTADCVIGGFRYAEKEQSGGLAAAWALR